MINKDIILNILQSMFSNYGYEYIIEDFDNEDAFFQFRIKELDNEEKNKSIIVNVVFTDYYELQILNKAETYDDLGYYHDCGEFTKSFNFWEILFNAMLD